MSRRKVRWRASGEEFATAPRQLLKLAIVILGRLDGRTAIVGPTIPYLSGAVSPGTFERCRPFEAFIRAVTTAVDTLKADV